MHSACCTCFEHDHNTSHTYGMPGWRGPWGGRGEGFVKIWEVGMCLFLCDMSMSDSDKWSEAYMHCPYIMGHLSSRLCKVQVSRIMSFRWQIACVIHTMIQMRKHGLAREVLWHMWCLFDVVCRDSSVWQGGCDNFILTIWVWQSEWVSLTNWMSLIKWIWEE